MAVYKSRRKDAAAQFIADARELRKYTVRVTRKFPKSYRDTTNGLTELAREIYLNSIKGNAIYLHKDISEHDYELRHRYLMIACSSADAICGEITFCYELVDEGNNFFAGKAEYEKVFQTWTTLANNVLSRLRAVLESDKKRWNGYDTLRTMDEKFVRLFEAELSARKKKFKCTMKATKTEAGWIYRRHGSVREEEAAA